MNATEIDTSLLKSWLQLKDTLVFCIGNSGRKDDGLAWALGEYLETWDDLQASLEFRYQLQVEDAALLNHFSRVIFVDASKEPYPGGFSVQPCLAEKSSSFTSHVLAPHAVLYVAYDLYSSRAEAVCLLISGTDWGLEIGLSDAAIRNLEVLKTHFLD